MVDGEEVSPVQIEGKEGMFLMSKNGFIYDMEGNEIGRTAFDNANNNADVDEGEEGLEEIGDIELEPSVERPSDLFQSREEGDRGSMEDFYNEQQHHLFEDGDDVKLLEDVAKEVQACLDKPVYALRLLKFLSTMQITVEQLNSSDIEEKVRSISEDFSSYYDNNLEIYNQVLHLKTDLIKNRWAALRSLPFMFCCKLRNNSNLTLVFEFMQATRNI